jgi:hypothetical protein
MAVTLPKWRRGYRRLGESEYLLAIGEVSANDVVYS